MKCTLNPLFIYFFLVLLPGYLAAQLPDTFRLTPAFRDTEFLSLVDYRIGTVWQPYTEHPEQWEKVDTNLLKVPGDSTVWFHFRIYNADTTDRCLELHLHNTLVSLVRLEVMEAQQLRILDSTGCLIPVSQRQSQRRNMSLLFTLQSGQVQEFYVSLMRRSFPNNIVLTLADTRYGDGSAWEDMLAIFVIGFCTLIGLFALAIWFRFRKREYFYYSIYITGGTSYLIAAHGFGAIYLWPVQSWFQEVAPVFFVAIGITGFILFANRALRIRAANLRLSRLLLLSVPMMLVLTSASLAFGKGILPATIYVPITIVSGIYTAFALTSILVFALWRAAWKKEPVNWWFVAIFGNLFILTTGALMLELGWFAYKHQIAVVATAAFVPLEMVLTMIYLIRQLYLREMAVVAEKEAQQRHYANLLHEIIKGEAQSALAEVHTPGKLKDQLTELVKTCELGYTFIRTENDDLHELLSNIEFIFSSRLHFETDNREFYCDLDGALKNIRLSHSEKYELIFWLRECLNNIRKYAGYQYAALKAQVEPSGQIVILVTDDGVGLQDSLGIQEHEIVLTADNFQEFYQCYLYRRRSTGILGLFDKAARLKGTLTIRSVKNQGTSLELRFFPNSG